MPRQPETIQGLSNQALVQVEIIEILNGYKIYCYPQREGETTIYFWWNTASPLQGRPREVRWVVRGLQKDQFIRIEPKDAAGDDMFDPPPVLDVSDGFNTITSGFPRLRPGPGKKLTWHYNIVLYGRVNGKAQQLDRLDPDVEIKDHP
jgi:hypothetical protein